MKQIWAPWRAEYIEAEKDGKCVFCTAPLKEPLEGLVLYSGKISSVILNKFPYNSGHLLISPIRHTALLEELTPEESADMFRLMAHAVKVLKEVFRPDGFNIGMNLGRAAGAGIDEHLHMHIVPRWNGDLNFMPVLSDVKVIPEHLHKTLEKLRPRFSDL
ncbi:MAG: HIT domain-containing protein [Deltaproteobacteria bacterium]|nr:HIT domain-containing protein [Deltaproteobacteria bacterium]